MTEGSRRSCWKRLCVCVCEEKERKRNVCVCVCVCVCVLWVTAKGACQWRTLFSFATAAFILMPHLQWPLRFCSCSCLPSLVLQSNHSRPGCGQSHKQGPVFRNRRAGDRDLTPPPPPVTPVLPLQQAASPQARRTRRAQLASRERHVPARGDPAAEGPAAAAPPRSLHVFHNPVLFFNSLDAAMASPPAPPGQHLQPGTSGAHCLLMLIPLYEATTITAVPRRSGTSANVVRLPLPAVSASGMDAPPG